MKSNTNYFFSPFNHFDNNEKTLFIFKYVDPHIYRLTAAYIHSCMEYRQKHVLQFKPILWFKICNINNVGNTCYQVGIVLLLLLLRARLLHPCIQSIELWEKNMFVVRCRSRSCWRIKSCESNLKAFYSFLQAFTSNNIAYCDIRIRNKSYIGRNITLHEGFETAMCPLICSLRNLANNKNCDPFD